MWHRYPACVASGGNVFFSIKLPTACTNNLAEYEAVCKGMELLLEAGAEAVEIFGDSKLVMAQRNIGVRVSHSSHYGCNVKS
jgi:ribonuclease HI